MVAKTVCMLCAYCNDTCSETGNLAIAAARSNVSYPIILDYVHSCPVSCNVAKAGSLTLNIFANRQLELSLDGPVKRRTRNLKLDVYVCSS